MKKITIVLLALLTLLFAFVSCNEDLDAVFENQQPAPAPEPEPVDYSKVPLTLEFGEVGEGAKITVSYDNEPVSFYYTINGATPKLPASGNEINVNSNDKISIYAVRDGSHGVNFKISCNAACNLCDVYGNIMSLIAGEDYADATVIGFTYAFSSLFNANTHIKSAENLILPATTLSNYCYFEMFDGCTSLTTAPVLPATTLAQGCYEKMFYGCSKLTTAPELPATTLAQYCYYNMFRDCTSLTTAPELPATSLAKECYYYMFFGCTSLNSITCLATDISALNCTIDWVYGVSATGTFTKAA